MTKKQALPTLNLLEQNGSKLLFVFLATCLITGALPCSAQTIIGTTVERAVTQKILSVPALSRQANLAARQKLQPLFSHAPMSALKSPQPSFPQNLSQAVFRVQQGEYTRSTASAFALEIDGRVWGVTAAHVMNNIHADPYVRVQNSYGKELTAPISSWYGSEKTDVAIFEIPTELKPYIQVLQPVKTPPQARQMATTLGFARGNPLYLPTEEILFSGPYRLLLRAQISHEMSGFCGSPVLVNEQVAGLHVGTARTQESKQTHWYELLSHFFNQEPPAMHLAAPIETVRLLAQEFTFGSSARAGIMMKVLNHPVALLTPHESLYTIQHLRNGKLKNTIYVHLFTDPEKLEQFFDLEENDIVRITVFEPKRQNIPGVYHIYEVNVSTGQVTQSNKKNFF